MFGECMVFFVLSPPLNAVCTDSVLNDHRVHPHHGNGLSGLLRGSLAVLHKSKAKKCAGKFVADPFHPLFQTFPSGKTSCHRTVSSPLSLALTNRPPGPFIHGLFTIHPQTMHLTLLLYASFCICLHFSHLVDTRIQSDIQVANRVKCLAKVHIDRFFTVRSRFEPATWKNNPMLLTCRLPAV